MPLYLLPLAAYLLGSISSAVVVARLLGLEDPRTVGSKNPGATNILRYGGKTAAALTLAGDILKGVIPVAAAHMLGADGAIVALTMLGAFLGHLYPVFFGFHGGKGVATALGIFLALDPRVGGLLAATWLATAALFRYSSLAAIVAALAAPLYVWWLWPEPAVLAVTVALMLLLLWRHRGNVQRLIAGAETRIGR
jgi:glycerol-3-phosphate acyltransferase PlsY